MATRTIVALFDTPADAEAASRDLKDIGVGNAAMDVHRHSGYGAGEGYGEIMPMLKGWGVPHEDAVAYAEGLRRGGALLRASFDDADAAARALTVLETRGAVDMTKRSAEWRATGWTGEPPPPMAHPSTSDSGTSDADRRLGDAADALRVSNAEVVPPPPSDPGTASPSFAPGSAKDVERQRLDRVDPERADQERRR